ncbi:hypothetical protein F4678DRAFT_478379 [Xylaria arbuscula]|nr:hypothetical protein F4678DRAFT_478379 [Xylaria arbuscula]
MPTVQQIQALFEPFSRGDGPSFFNNVVDNVDWTVQGAHCKIAGHYKSKAEFHEGTRALSSTWAAPIKLVVQDVLLDGNKAAVELKAVDTTTKNGQPFPNVYVWIISLNDEGKIVKVRAYMDTDLVSRVIEQNS